MTRGAVYVAYGDKARFEAIASAASLKQHCNIPISIISDQLVTGFNTLLFPDRGGRGRLQKTFLNALSPYPQTLYLDADTRVFQDISAGFRILDSGYDLVITLSANQGPDSFWHIAPPERETMTDELGYTPVQMQAGVFFFQKSPQVARFFTVWRREWRRFGANDQSAFIRALHQCPLKVWLLGRAWNGGAVIQHRFGAMGG